jgi:hypothetical protein
MDALLTFGSYLLAASGVALLVWSEPGCGAAREGGPRSAAAVAQSPISRAMRSRW